MMATGLGAPAMAVADPIRLARVGGCPEIVDALAACAPAEHRFLRAAWFRAAGAEATLVARRGMRPIAAFPTVRAGPPALGARAIAGIYWPFRNVPVAADASDEDIVEMLTAIRSEGLLGPLWRLGPVYAGDASAARLKRLAGAADWTVLRRSLGQTFIFDVDAAAAAGKAWPRKSSLKRLDGYEKQLGQRGTVRIDRIVGAAWSQAAFDAMAQIEARSWIGTGADQTGAKFLEPSHRRIWELCAEDPVLADLLSAVIVHVDDRPVAFSLDLRSGDMQYGIAGTYDAEFADLNVGKLANERNLIWAMERGVRRFDWGAGDSGYKRMIGFEAGPEIIDILFVRSPMLARLLRPRWERGSAGKPSPRDLDRLPLTRGEMLLIASLATATAFGAMAE